MTNDAFATCNNVFLLGSVDSEPTLSHELYGEGFYDFTVKVLRLSRQCDIIPITAAKKLFEDGLPKIGDKLAIEGQFRSYNKTDGSRSKLMLTVFVKNFVSPDAHHDNPNTVELSGYICKEPIYRTTPFNREICDLLVAVNRAFNKSDYIPCIAWGRNARFGKNLSVGTRISVAGRIQSREYIKKLSDDISETRTAYEISVGKIELDDEPCGVE